MQLEIVKMQIPAEFDSTTKLIKNLFFFGQFQAPKNKIAPEIR